MKKEEKKKCLFDSAFNCPYYNQGECECSGQERWCPK